MDEYNPAEWRKLDGPGAWLFTVSHRGRTASAIVDNEVRSRIVFRDAARRYLIEQLDRMEVSA